MLPQRTLRMAIPRPQIVISVGARRYDLSTAQDVSLHINHDHAPHAFGLPPARFDPFRIGSFVGSIEEGGPVRCDVVTVAPHGNGTHTECIGHIAGKGYTIPALMSDVMDEATLISVPTSMLDGDTLVSAHDLDAAWTDRTTSTLIIRTLPNADAKRTMHWSGDNPPYIHIDAMKLIVEHGVRHLMVDLPSVDREEDQGALVAHHHFWQWPHAPRLDCTISELVYVPDNIPDGRYLVVFNVAPFDGDAAPSRPMLITNY